MDSADLLLLLVGLVGLLVALVAGWLAWGRPLGAARADLASRSTEAEGLRERLAAAEPAVARAAELEAKLAAVEAATGERDRAHAEQIAQMRGEFQRLAGEALEAAQARFTTQAAETLKLHRAEAEKGLAESKTALSELIQPVRETLGRYGEELKQLEQKREQAYGSLSEQLQAVALGQQAVRDEAGKIVSALRSSAKASGAWGEAQLRNVLEMAGLREGIDFVLQESATDSDGYRRRPDAVLKMPGGRELVVDSKCALTDYLAATEAQTDAERQASLKRHALAIRAHAKGLSEKAYWKEFAQAADFVVMFLPGENFLSAALEQDLDLLSWALNQRILLAGPTNLLAIARVVAMVWRQEKMAKEARAIGDLGAELYERLRVMARNMNAVGKNLDETARAWNAFVGSVEGRVLVTGRKLGELGADRKGEALPEGRGVETALRLVQAEEARKLSDGG